MRWTQIESEFPRVLHTFDVACVSTREISKYSRLEIFYHWGSHR